MTTTIQTTFTKTLELIYPEVVSLTDSEVLQLRDPKAIQLDHPEDFPLADPTHEAVFQYLRAQSAHPRLYDFWKIANHFLFDGELRPVPIVVGLSKYGRSCGFYSHNQITIQHGYYYAPAVKEENPVYLRHEADSDEHVYSEKVLRVMAHEMCHQADREAGLDYETETTSRSTDIHYTQIWVDRVNSVMERLGEKRRAVRIRRGGDGQKTTFKADQARISEWEEEGFSLLTWGELSRWEPLSVGPIIVGSGFKFVASA